MNDPSTKIEVHFNREMTAAARDDLYRADWSRGQVLMRFNKMQRGLGNQVICRRTAVRR